MWTKTQTQNRNVSWIRLKCSLIRQPNLSCYNFCIRCTWIGLKVVVSIFGCCTQPSRADLWYVAFNTWSMANSNRNNEFCAYSGQILHTIHMIRYRNKREKQCFKYLIMYLSLKRTNSQCTMQSVAFFFVCFCFAVRFLI